MRLSFYSRASRGIKQKSAASILAEVGADMQQFPTGAQLSSWAGLCPANHESAGVKKSVRTNRGNVWLKTTLMQSAWASAKDLPFSTSWSRRWEAEGQAKHTRNVRLKTQWAHLPYNKGLDQFDFAFQP